MASEFDIAVNTLTQQNELQKFLAGNSEDENKFTSFFQEFPIYSRSLKYDTNIDPNSQSSNHIYELQPTHFIEFVEMIVNLPEIIIKSEYRGRYRVSWIPKTGIRMIQDGVFVQKDKSGKLKPVGNVITDTTFNFWFEYMAKRTFRTSYKSMLEDLEGQTQWGETIKAKTLLIPQPFFFSQTRSKGFKKILEPELGYSLKYKLQLGLSSLIRIQQLDMDKWVDVDSRMVITVIEPTGIQPPTLTTTNSIVGNQERDKLWRFGADLVKDKYRENFQELIQVEIGKPEVDGKGTFAIEINNPGCTRGIFFAVQNIDSTKYGSHFDYSFNGENPIVAVSLKNIHGKIYQEEDPIHFTKRHPRQAFLRTPKVIGMHYISLSRDGLIEIGADGHQDIFLSKMVLNIKYNIPKDMNGKIIVLLDMHRVISYEANDTSIYSIELK